MAQNEFYGTTFKSSIHSDEGNIDSKHFRSVDEVNHLQYQNIPAFHTSKPSEI